MIKQNTDQQINKVYFFKLSGELAEKQKLQSLFL